MADKDININVVAKADTSEIQDLGDYIAEVKDKAEEAGEALQTAFEEATAEVERLEDALAEAELNGDDIGADIIADELAEARDKAEELQEALDELNNTTVSPDVDSSQIDEMNDKVEETVSTTDSLTTALVGVGATAGLEKMISTADNINTSWNQLELTFGETGVSMDALKTKSTELSESTGRSGSTIRGYFNQMGIAGVTNVNLLQSSFEALSGKSYQTGNSIESMENKMQTMVLSGTASSKMLRSLGLSAEDLASVMGVSATEVSDAFKNLTPEDRLLAITQAMGDGKQANDMYKESYAGLKEQAEAAMAGLMGAVGQSVLPIIVPILQGATGIVKGFTSVFKSLPGPVQGAIGAIGGFLAIGTGVVGALGLVGKAGSGVVNGLKSLKSGYDTVKTAMGTAKTMMDALRNAESLTEGVRAALAIATGAEATAEGGAAAAKGAAVGPTTALAIAENSLLLPLLLIVGAIVAVIAVLWYLYNTNETVRNGIDGFISSVQQVGQILYDAFVNAVNWIIGALQNLWNYIITLGGLLPANVDITGNQIVDTILRVLAFILTLPIQIAMVFTNIIAKALGFGDNFVQNMIRAGSQSVSNFISYISQLPGKLAAELNNMLSAVGQWAATLPQKFWDAGVNAVKNFLSALGIASPGTMQRMLIWEITEMGRRVPEESKDLLRNVSNLGGNVIDEFGDPSLGVDYEDTMNAVVRKASSDNESSKGDTYIFNHYGDMDDDKRMRKFIDAVRKDIAWDNKTAGRIV